MDGQQLVRRIPLVLARAVPAPAPVTSAARLHHATVYAVWSSFALQPLIRLAIFRRAKVDGEDAPSRHDHHRHPQRRARQDARGAELHASAPPPVGRPDARCRAARASTSPARSSALGQPVIATGLAGGATGNRIVEALNDEAILNDFARIREESRTNTAVLDPTTGQHTEINERGPGGLAAGARAVPRQAAVPGQGRQHLRVRRQPAPRASRPTLRRPDPRAPAARRDHVVDTDGEPLRLALRAEPDLVCPNELEAEELVGHEFNDDRRPRPGGRRDAPPGAAEAIMTVADGCYAQVREDGRRAVPASGSSEQEARSRAIGSGDAFLAGYVAARYDGRPPAECLRFGVACGAESTQHFGAGLLDPFGRPAAARGRGRAPRDPRRDRLALHPPSGRVCGVDSGTPHVPGLRRMALRGPLLRSSRR